MSDKEIRVDQQKNEFEQRNISDDEIDLFELFAKIYAGKYLIIAVAAIFVMIAGAAVFFMKPVYRSTVQFLPAVEADLHEINKLHVFDPQIQKFSSDVILQLFIENVSSQELREQIFHQYDLTSLYLPKFDRLEPDQRTNQLSHAVDKFGQALTLVPPGQRANIQDWGLELSLKLPPQQVSTILNDIYNLALKKTVSDAYSALINSRDLRLHQTNDRITALRKVMKNRREDRVEQLSEAIRIARVLNIADPREVGPDMNLQGVSNQGLPLYHLGYRFLEAERDVLAARKSDDPFISELRTLQEWVSALEGMSVDPEQFRPVRLRQAAMASLKPEKPKPLLMIALASVSGLLVGIMIVLIRSAVVGRTSK